MAWNKHETAPCERRVAGSNEKEEEEEEEGKKKKTEGSDDDDSQRDGSISTSPSIRIAIISISEITLGVRAAPNERRAAPHEH